ncbi:MAG: methyl-accepting chemotaxis protein [Peptococcaceae bacterium]|nr:methyl-accepting chemotaxis protein [Peptococcaceae bacterium]
MESDKNPAFSLKAKLAGSFGLVLMLMVLTVGMNIYSLQKTSTTSQVAMTNLEQQTQAANSELNDVQAHVFHYALLPNPKTLAATQQLSGELSATGRALAAASGTSGRNMVATMHTYNSDVAAVLRAVPGSPAATADLKRVASSKDSVHAILRQIRSAAVRGLAVQDADVLRRDRFMIDSSLVLLALDLVAALLAAWLSIRWVVPPIMDVVRVVESVKNGDLTVAPPGPGRPDELGRLAAAVTGMMEGLRNLVGHIATKASVVLASARELRSSSQDIAAGATAAANMFNELSSAANGVNENAVNLAHVSEETKHKAEKGYDSIAEVGGRMQKIVDTHSQVRSNIDQLSDASKSISDIVDTIVNTSDRTNLLALNAAIEAARAGESGKGFAVVATEVRNLAEQSRTSANEIKTMLTSVQDSIISAAKAMQENEIAVHSGQASIDSASNYFKDIIHTIRNLDSHVQNIAGAAEVMQSSANNAASSINDQATNTRVIGSSVESLAEIATAMEKMVEAFRLT